MMLACPGLRVVPATIHIPLSEVPAALTEALLEETIRITHAGLVRDFGLGRPRIAVAGLNPHAGEGGAMGWEDERMIRPLVDRLAAEGHGDPRPAARRHDVPCPARAGYDVAVCAYHDQALIPIKTIDFAGGVNVTLGLPFVRTSPDHGTAYDIAGPGHRRSLLAWRRWHGEDGAGAPGPDGTAPPLPLEKYPRGVVRPLRCRQTAPGRRSGFRRPQNQGRARLPNRVKRPSNDSSTVPIGPWRCLPMMTSALPWHLFHHLLPGRHLLQLVVAGLLALLVVFLAEDEHHHIGVLFDRAGFAQVGQLRALVLAAFHLTRTAATGR
jgi:hypothetical protein